MLKRALSLVLYFLVVLSAVISQLYIASSVQTSGATGTVRIVKYAADGVTVLMDKAVSYEWMQKMLPVQGDGKTHYYHQGPIFEGDIWDPQEMNNLKDKGAVKGTAVKDLCDLAGGMSPGDDVSLVAVDNWHTEVAYSNIYQPADKQGTISLCWYNGEDPKDGELYGVGYPGNNAYHTALQIVFIAHNPNSEGKYVFGNLDMKAAFPEEKYQHYYQGQYPSSNGLSGKWIAEIKIYTGGIKPGVEISYTGATYSDSISTGTGTGATEVNAIPWVSIILGLAGLLFVALTVYLFTNRGFRFWKEVVVLVAGLLLITSSILTGIHPWRGQSGDATSKWELTLVGLDGKPEALSLDEIRKLVAYTARGGYFTTVGVVYGPYEAKGVPLIELCQLAGGITQSDIVMISSKDGYSTVFDYDQVIGRFPTYDPKTMKEVPHGELKPVLMYQQNGKPLSDDDGKPLRIAVVGPDGLLTEGNNWVKWVNKIEVLKMKGAN